MQEERYFLTQTALVSEEGESYITYGIGTKDASAAVEDISLQKEEVEAMIIYFHLRRLAPEKLAQAAEQMLALDAFF